jgi:LIVCS family branched-chain amino acid:cation transporter
MKKNHITRDSIIVGLALFSTMFGAGNLIFPPQIGLADGTQWGWGALGIVLTGVILPVLAFWGVNNVGTDVKCLMGHVHPKFYDVFYLIGCILVGMGSTLPRNGATTHEMGVLSIFPNAPSWLTMIIFFALVFFFGCDKGKVVDKLGKYLTPLLLILLAIVLVKGVISPIGTPQDTGVSKPLPSAMLTGYLTGDLTVGLMCANIFIGGILDKGHTNPLERKRSGLIVGLTSIVALGIIYIILTYIGACGGDYYDLSVPQTTLLSGLVGRVLGSFGKVCMGLAVSLACLTTAISQITAVADFYETATHGKLSYKVLVMIVPIVTTIVASFGLDTIVSLTSPWFSFFYPITLVMTILGIFEKKIPNDGAFKGAVYFTVIYAVLDLPHEYGFGFLDPVLNHIPLYGLGFGWIVPAIVGFIVGLIAWKGKGRTET